MKKAMSRAKPSWKLFSSSPGSSHHGSDSSLVLGMYTFMNLLFICISEQKCQRESSWTTNSSKIWGEFWLEKQLKVSQYFLFCWCLSRLWFLDQDNTIKKAKNLDDLLRVGNTLLKLSHRTVGLYLEYCNLKVNLFSDRACNQNS